MDLDAPLIAGYLAPYRMAGQSGKNVANNAAALREAASNGFPFRRA